MPVLSRMSVLSGTPASRHLHGVGRTAHKPYASSGMHYIVKQTKQFVGQYNPKHKPVLIYLAGILFNDFARDCAASVRLYFANERIRAVLGRAPWEERAIYCGNIKRVIIYRNTTNITRRLELMSSGVYGSTLNIVGDTGSNVLQQAGLTHM